MNSKQSGVVAVFRDEGRGSEAPDLLIRLEHQSIVIHVWAKNLTP